MRPEEARTWDEDELLGCTAPSHLPKSPIRLIRLCSRPTWLLAFLGSTSPISLSSFRLSGEEELGTWPYLLLHNTGQRYSSSFLLYPLSALHIRFFFFPICLSTINHLSTLLSKGLVSFLFILNKLSCNTSFLRSLTSGSFITCPTSIFSTVTHLAHLPPTTQHTSPPDPRRNILYR